MTFTTFVMFDMFNALCCRSADKIVPQMDMFANKAFIYSVGGSLLGQVRVAVFSYMGCITDSGVAFEVPLVYSQVHATKPSGASDCCIFLHYIILGYISTLAH